MAEVVGRLNDEYIKLTKHDLHRQILIKKNAICKITPAMYGDNGLRDIEGCTWIHLQNDRDYILVDEGFDTICDMLDA